MSAIWLNCGAFWRKLISHTGFYVINSKNPLSRLWLVADSDLTAIESDNNNFFYRYFMNILFLTLDFVMIFLPNMKSGFRKNQSNMTIMKQIKTDNSWHLKGPSESYFLFITLRIWASFCLGSMLSSPGSWYLLFSFQPRYESQIQDRIKLIDIKGTAKAIQDANVSPVESPNRFSRTWEWWIK